MTDADLLARYVANDLDEGQTLALEQRLDHEPRLADQLAALQEGLDALADVEALPPPPLNDGLLDTPIPTRPVPANTPWRWVAVAAAVLLAFFLGRSTTSQPMVTQQVEGVASLRFEGVSIDLDGRLALSWEPDSDVDRRYPVQEEGDSMHLKSALVGAAVGSVLSITVLEGRAWVSPAEARTVPIELQAPGASTTPAAQSAPVKSTPTAPSDARRIAELEQQVQQLTLANALVNGQMTARDGEAQPWPENVDPRLTEERLTAAVANQVGDTGQIVASECSEYPCFTFVDFDLDAVEGDRDAVMGNLMSAMSSDAYDGLNVPNVYVANFTDDDGGGRLLVGLAVQTDADLANDDLQKRMSVRGGDLLKELLHD